MYKELQDEATKYISYLKQVIKLQQEMIDAYNTMQSKAASAVKEIYQKILDTKLDAIDEEKEALEELRKAREQARKDQENAKAVSNLQTNLQRAMMDTSGASDIAFIKAQNDINDKLDSIADDRYSRMLDDISNQLDEEKEALQEECQPCHGAEGQIQQGRDQCPDHCQRAGTSSDHPAQGRGGAGQDV